MEVQQRLTSKATPLVPDTLTVWYNTKCPVCDAGIDRQRNRLVKAVHSGAIDFRDINQNPRALARYGATVEDIRRRLHGTDPTGHLHIGFDCAIEIWRRTPGGHWLATLFSPPALRWPGRLTYNAFATILYAWNRRMGHW